MTSQTSSTICLCLASCVVMKKFFTSWLNWKNYWVLEQPRTTRLCIICIQREKGLTETIQNRTEMTTEITWFGRLYDSDKADAISLYIHKLATLVHTICFNENASNFSFKSFNGIYEGSIAIPQRMLFHKRRSSYNLGQLLSSKKKYKEALRTYLQSKEHSVTDSILVEATEKFFQKNFLADKVELTGISFLYPTQFDHRLEDKKYMSSISFIFLLNGWQDGRKLEISGPNLCNVWDREDLQDVSGTLISPIDLLLHPAGVRVRYNSLKELYGLLDWAYTFFIQNLNLGTYGSNLNLICENELNYKKKDEFFSEIKEMFKKECISFRSKEEVDWANSTNESNWYSKEVDRIEELLKTKYVAL